MKKIITPFGISSLALLLALSSIIFTIVYTRKKQPDTAQFEEKISVLAEKLSLSDQELEDLAEKNSSLEKQLGSYRKEVSRVTGTVTDLQKLSQTDPELLQKYSKVFFLNEHYAPAKLTEVENKYKYNEARTFKVHAEVYPYLKTMFEDALDDGVTLYVASAFRSFNEQDSLKGQYTVTYGAGTANTFSADQGYSEHQLGTTLDFTTTGITGGLTGFQNTPAYTWLLNNAHKYGFTLSYPENNTYYIFEPWHWRFVGVELATYLYKQKKHFYDLEQREIDDYLIDLFD